MKYNILLRLVHWLTSVAIIGLILSGYFMTELNANNGDTLLGFGKWEVYRLHKSFGVIIIGLFVLRVLLRLATKTPELPFEVKPIDAILAKLGHFGLYMFIIAVPVSGVIMSMAGGYGVKVFGYALPSFIEKDKELGGLAHEIHIIIPYVMAGLIAVHIFAVFKHIIVDKVNLLKRMF